MIKKIFSCLLAAVLAVSSLSALSPDHRVDSRVEELSMSGRSVLPTATMQNQQHLSYIPDFVNNYKGEYSVDCFSEITSGASTFGYSPDQVAFDQASRGTWQVAFSDPGTGDWTEKWFLDGEIGSVATGKDGMQLSAGPQFLNDAHHAVLWTKDSFAGDIRIEYEYTRLDFASQCVNILYIQATGSGKEPFVKDITKWNDLRRVPAMSVYFNHMNTYHISYAASPGTPEEYIRARRYMPERKGLEGTELKPDYSPVGLFKPGIPHKITVIKKNRDLFMRIENDEQTYYCHFTNPNLPVVTEGRIGFRHMFTRSARYKNICISTAGDR